MLISIEMMLNHNLYLPGFGDAGNLSVFYEDDKHTFRVAANYRGETVAGLATMSNLIC